MYLILHVLLLWLPLFAAVWAQSSTQNTSCAIVGTAQDIIESIKAGVGAIDLCLPLTSPR